MKNKLFISIIITLGIVGITSAQSVSGAVIGGTTSVVSPYCPTITQNLQKGDRDRNTNGQVSELQKFLNSYYSQDLTLGYFGPLTKKYVTKFQMENKIWGIGTVGPLTRAKIAEKCGTGTTTEPKFCTMQYDPVCGTKNGDKTTFGNSCEMDNAGYSLLYKGQCTNEGGGDVTNTAPANCKVWYDGCNTCSRETPGSPMACTLMYCFQAGTPSCKQTF